MSKTSITIIGLLTLVIIGLAWVSNYNSQRDVGRIVFNACEKSRVSNTVSEEKCGQLQDQYKYEYLCKDFNSAPTTRCWVESNDLIGEK